MTRLLDKELGFAANQPILTQPPVYSLEKGTCIVRYGCLAVIRCLMICYLHKYQNYGWPQKIYGLLARETTTQLEGFK